MAQSDDEKNQPMTPAAISPVWIVGFAGHRTGVDEAVVAPMIEQELQALDAAAREAGGAIQLYSSIADGADLIALDGAERLGLDLHVVLPVPEQDFFRPFPSAVDRRRAEQRLEKIRAAPERHSWRLAPTSMRLPEAYFEADARIVEVADVMLVVWDGEPERGLGGTAQIVALARARRVPVIWINQCTGKVRRESLPAQFWHDPVLTRLRQQGVLRFAGGLQPDPEAARAVAQEQKRNFSAIANADAKWFRHSSMKFLLCNLGASVLAAFSGLLPHASRGERAAFFTLAAVELGLLVRALTFKYGAKRKNRRALWVDCRMAADLWRSLHASQPLLDPLYPLMAGEGRGLDGKGAPDDWRRFALTVGLLLRRAAPDRDWRRLRDGQYRQRLKGQISYFRSHGTVPVALRYWQKLARFLTWAAPVVVVASVIYRVWVSDAPPVLRWAAALLPVFLPILITLPESVKAGLDLDRREKRYPDMAGKLERLESELAKVQTEESLRQLVVRAETLLLDELGEWRFSTSRLDPG